MNEGVGGRTNDERDGEVDRHTYRKRDREGRKRESERERDTER